MAKPFIVSATRVDPLLVDAVFDRYIEWKDASSAVWETYAQWQAAISGDRASTFAAYEAAVDAEQAAGESFAELLASAAPSEPARAHHGAWL